MNTDVKHAVISVFLRNDNAFRKYLNCERLEIYTGRTILLSPSTDSRVRMYLGYKTLLSRHIIFNCYFEWSYYNV